MVKEPNDEDDTHACDGYSAGSGLVWGNGTCHSPARPSPGLGNANAMKSRPTVGGDQVIWDKHRITINTCLFDGCPIMNDCTEAFCQRHYAPSQAQLARLHKAHKNSTISSNKPIKQHEQLRANIAPSSVTIDGEQLCHRKGIVRNNIIKKEQALGRLIIISLI